MPKFGTKMNLMRLILLNLLIFIGLIIGLNLVAGLVLDIQKWESRSSKNYGQTDARVNLPSYSDKEFARQVFHDFYLTRTAYYSYEDIRLEQFSSITTNIDSNGLRVVPGAPHAPTGYIRFFGGSTMWGTGASDSGTIPALVQKHFPKYKVINYGQSGLTSGQSLAILLKIIRSKEPLGTVIFYDGVNDFFHLCQKRISIDDTGFTNFIKEAIQAKQNDREKLDAFTGAIIGNLIKLTFVKHTASTTTNIANVPASGCTEDAARVATIADNLFINWELAKNLVESNGGKFISVLQPVSSVGTPNRASLPKTEEWDKWYRDGYLIMQKKMVSYTWAKDLSDSFDGNAPLYIDWAHVTANGNHIIASKLTEILSKSINSVD